ncbi:MAG TPA: hypothetical protein VFT43_03695 [Candidatus Polarisedimenticolia bacterium]|nr:hypothetical protein [Candidatus Polarisedimenticolia bacterium]
MRTVCTRNPTLGPLLVFALLICLLANGGALAQTATPPSQPPAAAGSPAASSPGAAPTVVPEAPSLPPPLPAGPAPDLDLVFTAQVAGWIEPCG